ncbi:MAG: hypothetical protein AB7T49_05010 [Oligoflexales bacterium]
MGKNSLFFASLLLAISCKQVDEGGSQRNGAQGSNVKSGETPTGGNPGTQPGTTTGQPNTTGTPPGDTTNTNTGDVSTNTDGDILGNDNTGANTAGQCGGAVASLTCSGNSLQVCMSTGGGKSTQGIGVSSCPPDGLTFSCAAMGSSYAVKISYSSGGSSSSQSIGGFASSSACETVKSKLEADYSAL